MNDFMHRTTVPLAQFKLVDVLDTYGNWTFRAPISFQSAYEGAQMIVHDQEFSCVEAYVKIPYLVARQSHVMVAFSHRHFGDKFVISLPRGVSFEMSPDQDINQVISEIKVKLLNLDLLYLASECSRQLRDIFSELDLLPEHFKLAMSQEIAFTKLSGTVVDVLACYLTKQVNATFWFHGDKKLHPLHKFIVGKIAGEE